MLYIVEEERGKSMPGEYGDILRKVLIVLVVCVVSVVAWKF